ncbi:RBM7 protein, partial [Nothoprocta ornata]|nr:RBM7 protein [Nothoprocta ornata]
VFPVDLQAGPVIKVKIPKDRDGKPKQFAFVNFKHEESVPYGMSLLNGIKLFGRPIKIQFRSGSAAEPPAVPSCDTSNPVGRSSAPRASCSRWWDEAAHAPSGPFLLYPALPHVCFFLADTTGVLITWWQQDSCLYRGLPNTSRDRPWYALLWHSVSKSLLLPLHRTHSGAALRKARMGAHPYFAEGRHFAREPRFAERPADYGRPKRDDYSYEERSPELHYRAGRDEGVYSDRVRDAWSHDYDSRRESYREGRWCPARH